MRLVRIGVASISVKVGDFKWNTDKLREAIEAAKQEKVHLLVTPELGISGYSLEDRIFWPDIARHSWAEVVELAKVCKGISVFVGLPVAIDSLMYNAAALLSEGKVRGLLLKRYLPTYSIFYEGRNWTAWPGGVTEVNGVPAGDLIFQLPFGKVSGEICEDMWSSESPAHERVRAGAEIICNLSASPFTPRKNADRKRLVLNAANTLKSVYAYSNLLGCDSSRIICDGGGIIATPESIVCSGPILSKRSWTLAHAVVDLDQIAQIRAENTTWRQESTNNLDHKHFFSEIVEADDTKFSPAPVAEFARQLPDSFYAPKLRKTKKNRRNDYLDELYDALVIGMRDYFEKTGVFERFLIALSGGRDSALCLMIAVDAAKALKEGKEAEKYAERIDTVYLPNKAFSTSGTHDAAQALANELGVPFKVVSIHEEAEIATTKAAEMVEGEDNIAPMARQNLQARIRGAMMLNWGNSAGGLVLVTSNLSEAAVGYTTTGGDNEGGYSPIANLPKTLVTELLEYLADRDGIKALQKVLDIPPSAELAPDQEDEKDLMPYVVLDDLLYLYARNRYSLSDCWRLLCCRHPEHDPETLRTWTADFGKRFAASQWKRDQHPVSMKVMVLDLDPKTGFRFPVSQSIDYELDALKVATLESE